MHLDVGIVKIGYVDVLPYTVHEVIKPSFVRPYVYWSRQLAHV